MGTALGLQNDGLASGLNLTPSLTGTTLEIVHKVVNMLFVTKHPVLEKVPALESDQYFKIQ